MFRSLLSSRRDLISMLWHPSQHAARRRNANNRRGALAFERLEDRRVLSTVTSQAGLIAAINAANAAGGSNTITLGKNITLFETTADNNTDGPNGLPAITSGDNLTINAGGHTIQRSTTATDVDFRFFDVSGGASLTLNKITLKNGLVAGTTPGTYRGGAIFIESGCTLTLNESILSGNAVRFNSTGTGDVELDGGAIHNAGTANINASVITGNSASFSVTNATNQGNSQGSNQTGTATGDGNDNGLRGPVVVGGGGIYNTGSLSIINSTISKNSATSSVTNGSKNPAGGIGNGNNNGDDNSNGANFNGNFNGNGVWGNILVEGGGICNLDGGSAELQNDVFIGNRAASTVVNGSDNGNNNSDNDNGDNNGDNNGNGVTGEITVAGGALYSNSTFETTNSTYVSNSVSSSVTNGNNNGNNNGDATENFDGNENGDGVDGDITLYGGAIANDGAGAANIIHCTLVANSVSTSIANGNNNGNGNGQNNAGLGNNEGKNNGNGVAGFVHVSGGGIDNENSTQTVVISNCIISANSIKSRITNGNNSGNADGNNDGDGDGLASVDNSVDVLVLHGAGIHNNGDLSIISTFLTANSITSTILNGNNDGDNVGNNNQESNDGRANGNCVSGDILLAGGGIANSGALDVNKSFLMGNLLISTIANGKNDGDNDGQSDGANDNCGNNCGNAVGGDVEIDGGGLGNSGTATVSSSTIAGNLLLSTVTNGKGNGVNDGGGSPASTGTDGQGDGNGLNGDLEVIGGGTANATGGTLTLNSTTVKGNVIHSSPSSGSGDETLDGKIVNGTVTVNGANSF